MFFKDEDEHRAQSDVDRRTVSSSSSDSVSGLVPGHRMWASRSGRHILGLIEDYNALRKQISEGRKLSRSMITQQQECLNTFRQLSADNKAKIIMFKLLLVSVCGLLIDNNRNVKVEPHFNF